LAPISFGDLAVVATTGRLEATEG